MQIAYLGPEASYTHAAALKHFGDTHEFLACKTIDVAFTQVQACQADCAVVPVENSTYGAVDVTLDNLINSELSIDGEILLPVEHALLSGEDDLANIHKIYAHPQAFAQCRLWLDKCLPNAARIECSSNSQGAKIAATDPESAAIAGVNAAPHYSLSVLAEKIQDIADNTTRFLVIARPQSVERLLNEAVEPVAGWSTSLLLSADNRPGALFRLIKPLAEHGVSMTRIESRPSRKAAWDYLFMLDIEGRVNETHVTKALSIIQNEATLFRVLGSYPRALT